MTKGSVTGVENPTQSRDTAPWLPGLRTQHSHVILHPGYRGGACPGGQICTANVSYDTIE
ncbi:hypothetical protein DPMN_076845 [Dreissena polymorpha]|uniref:Uncharacterized protein n=1 Tax=Dreissena polymorpha TaxID=45954 RepID=A0A9D3YJF2_DREPO|nr:hypothetical protein DPMN_076845 [Dreissena polymorpha]